MKHIKRFQNKSHFLMAKLINLSDSNELEHDPVNGHNTGLELDIALNIREKKYFNIDLIKNINYTSSSLKQSQIEFEKQTEEFQIKLNMNKYNL